MELELNENFVQKNQPIENQKKFNLQGKNFFLTYPKCLLEKEEVRDLLLNIVPCECIIIAKELHKDGTPHIHVFMTTDKKVRTKLASFFDLSTYHGNYQTARDSDDVYAYICKTDLQPLYYGKYSGNKQTVVQKRALQNKLMLSKTPIELVDEGYVHISQYKSIKDAINMYNIDKVLVPDYMPKECIWIYGKTGTGKSRYIRDNHPNIVYFKAQNKWWDGYSSEKIILIDDFDLAGQCLGHYLKIWADCYSFVAEVKGSTIKPIIDTFYVTSQYLPRQIWCSGNDESKWDYEMKEAIERRFRIVEVIDGKLVNYSE